ncbi:MAG TPA: PAS domain S-box protein [Burkholderiales bacterium]|nr:PAS domain S-box protein [Burkholderiales bacterium]
MLVEQKVNILLVDDEPAGLLALEAVLAPLGQNLVKVGSGREALQQLLALDFVLILLDVRMPGMDGLETASLIRRRKRNQHVPIIFLTAAHHDDTEVFRGYAVGAVDYVFKPIQAEILRSKAAVFVELAQITALVRRQAAELAEREAAARSAAMELTAKEEHFRSVAQSANEAIISADRHGNIVFWNEGARRTFGYEVEEILGKPLAMLIPERYREAHIGGLQRYLSKGEARVVGKTVELEALGKDGAEFPIELSLAAWRSYGEVFFTAILRDITERKRAEESIKKLHANLAQHAAQLEATNKELESFSYSISHDLRAPLRAIDGFSRMLEQSYSDKIGDSGARLLHRICVNAQRMAMLIDDLLAFSRLGRQSISTARINMTALVKEVLNELAGIPGQPAPDCVLHPLPEAWGDRALIRQVWVNLLSNAIKFTGHKTPALIEVRGEQQEGDNIYWVRDNGAGFDMRYMDKLFGVFQRLHSMDQFPGTGVGLAIVQRVITRHGGRVWAESKLDEGSTFYFALPVTKRVNQLDA